MAPNVWPSGYQGSWAARVPVPAQTLSAEGIYVASQYLRGDETNNLLVGLKCTF